MLMKKKWESNTLVKSCPLRKQKWSKIESNFNSLIVFPRSVRPARKGACCSREIQ